MNYQNQNINVMTPSNYYGATGQPVEKKSKKILFVALAVAIVVAIIGGLVILSVVNNNNSSPGSIQQRENTAVLDLYANLDSEMTLEELKQELTDSKMDAEIIVEDGGFGSIVFSDYTDAIYFYIDREDENYEEPVVEISEEDDGLDENGNRKIINIVNTYQPVDKVYDFRYSNEESPENNIGIYYDETDNVYEVFNGVDSFQFTTKQEAIAAYLSPFTADQQTEEEE